MNSRLSGRIVLGFLAAVLLLAGFGLTDLVVSNVHTDICFFSFAVDYDACWLLAGVSLFSGIAVMALGGLVVVQGVLPHQLPLRLKQSRIRAQAVTIVSISVSVGILALLISRVVYTGFGYLMILITVGAVASLWLTSISRILQPSDSKAAAGAEEASGPSTAQEKNGK